MWDFNAFVAKIPGHTRFTQITLRLALLEYNASCPRQESMTMALTSAGTEIILPIDPLAVTRVYFPWDIAKDISSQQPNQVSGWETYITSGSPALSLRTRWLVPQSGDHVRIHYTLPHSISSLAGELNTTLPAYHEEIIVVGAAGFAVLANAANRGDNLDRELQEQLGNQFLERFRSLLSVYASAAARSGTSLFPWKNMDKYGQIY